MKGKFHEADIEDELIRGFPWLQENNLAVLTTEGALGCGWENEILLTGWEKEDIEEGNHTREYPVTWKIRKMALHLTDETEMFGETSWVKGGRILFLGKMSWQRLKQNCRLVKNSQFEPSQPPKANGENTNPWSKAFEKHCSLITQMCWRTKGKPTPSHPW